MNGLLETLRRLGPTRLITMGSIAAMLIVGLVILTERVSTPDLALLYSDLDVKDSSAIVSRLEAMNIPFDIRGNGGQVYVPREQVMRLRLSMAQDGLPVGGSVGYELFDRSDGFGSNSFVQKINRVRALEGELARTIRTIDRVAATRVHLVLPEREIFARRRRKPSASIVIKMRGDARLRPSQVKAMQHLVAAAVPELEPTGVSIVDDRGTLLSRSDNGSPTAGAEGIQEARRNYEAHLKNAVEALVEQSVGIGNVRAEVSADMNFDRVTTNAEHYDPDGQVVRSTQTVEETTAATETSGENSVSVANNLSEAQVTESTSPESQNQSQRSEETVNYEISKTVKTEVHETGKVNRLSVAVLVDGRYTQQEDGTRVYAARDKAELDQIGTLVKSAIGYDENRGDRVEVVNLQFFQIDQALPEAIEEPAFLNLSAPDYFRIGEILALVVVALLTALVVIRPVLAVLLNTRPSDNPPAQIAGRNERASLPAPSSNEQNPLQNPEIIAAVEAGEISAKQLQQIQAASNAGQGVPESLIDIAQIEGLVKESSARKVGELVEKHPDEALSIIRSWMYQES